jgi:type IV secretory pathway VirB10-like protein
MKISDLKKGLNERGYTCEGCAEKADYVDRFLQVQFEPIIATPIPSPPPPPPPSSSDFDVEKIMAQMQENKKRQERIKRKMREKGYDESTLDMLSSLSGSLGGGKDMTDDQMMKMMESLAGKVTDEPSSTSSSTSSKKGKENTSPSSSSNNNDDYEFYNSNNYYKRDINYNNRNFNSKKVMYL